MATYTSAASGLWSAGATWVGGVKPPSGAGHKIVIASPHVVTYDEAAGEYGDDTTSGVTVNGTFKWSRTVSTTFTCRGEFVVANGGKWDRGTSVDPIPLGVVATFKANYSLTPADGKYGITFNPAAIILNYGYARTTNTRLVNDIASTATSCRVENASGWQVGDTIVFAPTGSDWAQSEVKTIGTITLVSGTIYDITWTGGVAFAHAAKGSVGNFTSNVVNTTADINYRSYWYEISDNTITNYVRENRYMSFYEFGTNNASTFWRSAQYCIYSNSSGYINYPYIGVSNITFFQTTVNSGGFIHGNYKGRLALDDFAYYLNTNAVAIRAYQGAISDFNRHVCYKAAIAAQFSYSEGARNSRWYDCIWTGCNNSAISVNGGPLTEMYRCIVYSCLYPWYGSIVTTHNYYDCQIGSGPDVPVGASFNYAYLCNGEVAGVGEITLQDTMFDPTKTIVYDNAGGFQRNLASFKLTLVNKNKDVTQQEIYRANAAFIRDNTIKSRGTSSIKMETRTSVATNFETIYISASNGAPITIKGRLRKNAAYGSLTRPKVTLSGLSITPQVFTMTDTVDTWEEFTFTVTPTSGVDGNLSLVFTGQSANTAGICYLDGVLFSPFVNYVDHYGYLYAPTSNSRVVDPLIVLSESAVSALTGISYAAGTLTITSNKTTSQIYDWVRWYATTNQLPPMTSSNDGVIFTFNGNLTLNNCAITGTGKVDMHAHTLTLVGNATSQISIQHNAGTLTSIVVSGFVSGSNVQVYNTSTATELFNGVVAGTSLTLPATWTTNQSIRTRVVYVSGVTAKLPVEINSTLRDSGASVTITQADDLVYNANAIDGSLVTEFTPNYASILVEVTDPDGVTSIQRLYAWYSNVLMTPAGIAATQGGIIAEDILNYKIVTAILNVKVKNMSVTPTILSGARLYRDDGVSIFAVGVGPIQLESGKAYQAPNVVTLTQIESSTILAKEATNQLIKAKTDVQPTAAQIATAVDGSTVLAKETTSAAIKAKTDVMPSASQIATAVDGSTVLAKEATNTAIKAKTDTIPLDPATNAGVWEVAVPVTPTVGSWSALLKTVLTVAKFLGLK